jgi:hypothetical protein
MKIKLRNSLYMCNIADTRFFRSVVLESNFLTHIYYYIFYIPANYVIFFHLVSVFEFNFFVKLQPVSVLSYNLDETLFVYS